MYVTVTVKISVLPTTGLLKFSVAVPFEFSDHTVKVSDVPFLPPAFFTIEMGISL